MKSLYISTLILISFLLKSQQISNPQLVDLNPKIEQLTSQVSALQSSFNTSNEYLEKIADGVFLITKGVEALSKENKKKIEDEKVPGFLIQDVINLYEEYKNKINNIKELVNNLSKNDPISFKLRNAKRLKDEYENGIKTSGSFWNLVDKEINKLKSYNPNENSYSFFIISDLQKILLRNLETFNNKTEIN